MKLSPVSGIIEYHGKALEFQISGNELQQFTGTSFETIANQGVVTPTS
jgi:hypothetical protein